MKTNVVIAALVAALSANSILAQGNNVPREMQSISKMESRTKDKKREPGLFGDHWWANRFLSRHMEIEKFKGKSVDASGWVPKTIMRDEIHPTAAGYDIWMEALAPVIGK